MKDKVSGLEEVAARFGGTPVQVIEVQALAGDSSDNVPGVPGIGEKTAVELIREFGSVDNLLANLERVKGKRRENLATYAEQARLSKQLVTLRDDVPLELDYTSFALSPPDRQALTRLFKELEFHKLLQEFSSEQQASGEGYRCVLTAAQLASLATALQSVGRFAVDTETTGLDPVGGDEIIQIGATRVVNGKLLRSECFEQLVDPQRSIPEASIPIHGITLDMVRGKPTIDEVLPAFHAYVQDTVLVAHNAAFDMRFLQLKAERTGVHFEQPVLDTLLLSAVIHPNQESHRLEAIAERFNVTVIGRHTALGDALVTAEVFQKLIPLLADRGIHTLGQAREAAQQSYYARLKY